MFEDQSDAMFGGEPVFFAEDIGFAVLDESVWPADAFDWSVDAGGVEVFDDAAAEAVVEDVVFEGADDAGAAGEAFEGGGVERFDPARVDEGDGVAHGGEHGGGGFGHFEERAETDEADVAAFGEDLGFTDFEELGGLFDGFSGERAARVADGGGAVVVIDHGPEHVDEFVFVFGLHVDEAGDVAEVADVEEPVVGGAVVAAEAAAVHAEADGEVLERDVMNDHVIGALHERGVDGEDGFEALSGETAGEEGGMFFGDADVEVAFGDFFLEETEAGAAGHGCGDGGDGGVGFGEADHAFGEDLGAGRGGRGIGFAGFDLVGAEPVEFVRVGEGGFVAAAFFGDDVEDDGFVLGFEELERLDEEREIVAIDGAVVAEPEFLEDDGGEGWVREDEIFGAAFDASGHAADGFAGDFLDEGSCLLVEVGVGAVGRDGVEVLGDGADIFVDGPFVVVEDDDELFGGSGDVVECFEGGAAGEGGVAGDADDVFVGAFEVAGDGEAEGGADGGAGVACAVAVVRAFGAEEEAVEALVLAHGAETVPAAGEHFMDVALVADVEDEFVFGGFEDPMEGDGEFDDAEVGAEVAAGAGEGGDEVLADAVGEEEELFFAELFNVLRTVDLGERGFARRVGFRHRKSLVRRVERRALRFLARGNPGEGWRRRRVGGPVYRLGRGR